MQHQLLQQPGVERAASPAAQLTDRSLMRRFRAGSEEAAAELYVRYAKRVRALARARCSAELAARIDADDIVQSVFRSFFHAARKGYYDIPAGEELWRILLVIALNKIRDARAFHTAAKRDVRLTAQGDGPNFRLDHLQGKPADHAFLQMAIKEALQTLPAQHQRMVELRIQGYEVSQIAQETGRSKRSVERVLQETRKRLDSLFT
jgi:RNA polymerase sigma-70 factor (ECF subfamily)